jgi:hypothetical protein
MTSTILSLGKHLSLTFQRTLRIPDDGSNYPLPPGLGAFPIHRVADYADRVPAKWRERPGAVFIPMYQREAMWLSFHHAWPPCALKVGVGGVDAISGERFDPTTLDAKRQDYLVLPDQPWLDGINAGDGFIRQFVAMPLGMGYTVEGQLTGTETEGGIRLTVVPAKPGRFPENRPQVDRLMACAPASAGASMGLGAGGRMLQTVTKDPHGVETWELSSSLSVDVHIATPSAYGEITGFEPPPTPVSARTYTQHGYPWFEHYAEGHGDVAPSKKLSGVRSIRDMDAAHGFRGLDDDHPIVVPPEQLVPVKGHAA